MAFMTEEFATERLRAVPLAVGHAEEMAGVLADPALYAVIGGAPPAAADLRRRYAAMAAGPPDGRSAWCNWVLDDGAGLVGTVQATVTFAVAEPEAGPAGAAQGTLTRAEPGAEAEAGLVGAGGSAWAGAGAEAEAGLVGHVQRGLTWAGAGAEADLAWIIGAPWQRRGYATEAARGMVGWLAGAGVARARAMVAPGHTPSERVARACGLVESGQWEDGERVWAGAIGRR